jgi:DNA-directed RNA polymerase subunit N (RpoN/RPB10)
VTPERLAVHITSIGPFFFRLGQLSYDKISGWWGRYGTLSSRSEYHEFSQRTGPLKMKILYENILTQSELTSLVHRPTNAQEYLSQCSSSISTCSFRMIIPIRCFSCGKVWLLTSLHRCSRLLIRLQVTGDLWERYLKLIEDEKITDG